MIILGEKKFVNLSFGENCYNTFMTLYIYDLMYLYIFTDIHNLNDT